MRNRADRRVFGPVDPYVMLPVAGLASLALVMLLQGWLPWGLGAAAFAGLLIAFDSWANRHEV